MFQETLLLGANRLDRPFRMPLPHGQPIAGWTVPFHSSSFVSIVSSCIWNRKRCSLGFRTFICFYGRFGSKHCLPFF